MIIDGKTIIITLIIIAIASYFGLNLIRSFALSIAQENHDANLAIDMTEQSRRLKRERLADEAAHAAFARVEPLLPISVVAKNKKNQNSQNDDNRDGVLVAAIPSREADAAAAAEASSLLPQSADPSNVTIREVDEETP